LFEAEPKTNGGLTELLLSAETLFDILPEFEFFLILSSLFPNEVLDSLSV